MVAKLLFCCHGLTLLDVTVLDASANVAADVDADVAAVGALLNSYLIGDDLPLMLLLCNYYCVAHILLLMLLNRVGQPRCFCCR